MANRYLVRATLLLCATFAGGCDDDGAGDGAGGSESTGATGDTDPTGGADPGSDTGESSSSGAEDDGFRYCDLGNQELWELDFFECETPSVCDQVNFVSDRENALSSPITLTDPSPAQCVLEALRDDVAATHVVSYDRGGEDGIPGQYLSTYTIEAFGDGTIVVNAQLLDDKAEDLEGTWAERQPTEFFEACLTETDAETIFECLTAPVNADACIDAPPTCPADG